MQVINTNFTLLECCVASQLICDFSNPHEYPSKIYLTNLIQPNCSFQTINFSRLTVISLHFLDRTASRRVIYKSVDDSLTEHLKAALTLAS